MDGQVVRSVKNPEKTIVKDTCINVGLFIVSDQMRSSKDYKPFSDNRQQMDRTNHFTPGAYSSNILSCETFNFVTCGQLS